jgi:hypothetical protein
VTDDPRETGERWPNGGRVIRSRSGFVGCDCENAPYCGHPDADHAEALFREIVGGAAQLSIDLSGSSIDLSGSSIDLSGSSIDLSGSSLIHAVEMGPFGFEWWRSPDGSVVVRERWKNGFERFLEYGR